MRPRVRDLCYQGGLCTMVGTSLEEISVEGMSAYKAGWSEKHTVLRCVERGMVGEKEEDAEIAVKLDFVLRWFFTYFYCDGTLL